MLPTTAQAEDQMPSRESAALTPPSSEIAKHGKRRRKRNKSANAVALNANGDQADRAILLKESNGDNQQSKETQNEDSQSGPPKSPERASSKKEKGKKRKKSSASSALKSNSVEAVEANHEKDASEAADKRNELQSQAIEEREVDEPQLKRRKTSKRKDKKGSLADRNRDGVATIKTPPQQTDSKKRKRNYQNSDAGTEQGDESPIQAVEELSGISPRGKGRLLESKDPRPAEAEADQKDDDAEGIADDARLVRTLFVGNVPQEATRKDLKKLFKQFGKVESIRIRGVVPVNPKIPKRVAFLTKKIADFSDSFQAYVVFEDKEDVTEVMNTACKELNMTVFQKHHIRVMPASQKRQGPRKQSLFLGNLPFDCSEEDIVSAFKGLADSLGVKILNVRVNRDKDTGVGRGVGFISFDDALGIRGCINAAGEVKIKDRVLRMEPASKMKKVNTKTFKRQKGQNNRGKKKTNWKAAREKPFSGKQR